MISKLSIKQKLILIMLIPLIIVILLASKLMFDAYGISTNLKNLNHIVFLSTKIGSLVHEIQRERGMTVGFMVSNGKNFKEELPIQRKNVDEKFNDLKIFAETINGDISGKKLVEYLNSGFEKMNKLKNIREQINSLSISELASIDYYIETNKLLLSNFETIVWLSNTLGISKKLVSYMNFLLAKEKIGIERAIGTNALAIDNFFQEEIKFKFYSLIAEQAVYLDSFIKISSDEVINYYKQIVKDPVIEDVEKMRKMVFFNNINSGFGIDPNYWFSQMTQKINLLKKVEDYISEDLIFTINTRFKNANTHMIIFGLLTLLGVLLTVILVRAIVFIILIDIRNVKTGVENILEFIDFKKYDIGSIDIVSNSEDVELSKNMDKKIEEAKSYLHRIGI